MKKVLIFVGLMATCLGNAWESAVAADQVSNECVCVQFSYTGDGKMMDIYIDHEGEWDPGKSYSKSDSAEDNEACRERLGKQLKNPDINHPDMNNLVALFCPKEK